MYEFDAPHVKAARRLIEDKQLQRTVELARDDHLLLVPPRQRGSGHGGRRHPDVVLLDLCVCRLQDGRILANEPASEWRAVVAGQDQIVEDRKRQYQAEPMPVAGHVAGAGLVHSSRRQAGDIEASESHLAGTRFAQPNQSFNQLVLAVAGDAGNTEYLACSNLECRVGHRLAPVIGDAQPFHLEHRAARVRLTPIDGQLHRSPDHEFGEFRLRCLARLALADNAPASDDGNTVGDGKDFVQLVADEDDRPPIIGEPAQQGEDLLGFLRSKNGGRLVQDQDSGVAV